MTKRRLSQAISEGDGISVIVGVESAEAARDAEAAGAEGVLVSAAENLATVRAETELPILVVHDPERPAPEAADACIVDVDGEDRDWLEQIRADLSEHWELAPRIGKEEHLEFVLEELDPEVLGLRAAGDEPLADALELLQDVPAGKLAIADVGASTREQVAELERAGMDAVIVYAGNIADLVGSAPPEV